MIEFNHIELISVHSQSFPSEYLKEFIVVPGESTQLIRCSAGEGSGTWIYRFGDSDTADSSISLKVPGKATPKATSYFTTLTWELSAAPEN